MLITQTEVQAERERVAQEAALLALNRAALQRALNRAGTTPLFESEPRGLRYGDKYAEDSVYGAD